MKVLLLTVLVIPAFCQTPTAPPAPTPTPENTQAAPQTTQAPAKTQPPATKKANRSTIAVKPGENVLKNKDFYEATGYWHPFRRMLRFTVQDQKAIWTSPFHTKKEDVKWWLIFGAATGALIAADESIQQHAPNTSTLVDIGTKASNLGAAYSLIPISAGFYFIGTATHRAHFRETGLVAFETLIDTTVVELAIKTVTYRERPLDDHGEGHFWSASGGPWNASFPSGHSINTFGLASVFAHEYPHKWWIQLICYGYAAGVLSARLAANKHFPSDVVAGGAMGWFIGDYVYAKRHNPDVDKKPTVAQKVLSHVRVGGALQSAMY